MSQSSKPKWNDRHNIPKPTSGLGKTGSEAAASQQQNGQTVQWAGWRNGCRDRIADLFKTVGHLDSHVQEIQTKFVSLSNGVKKNEIEPDKAKALFKEMCDCIKKSADGSTPSDLDAVGGVWGPCEFSCDSVSASYSIQRTAAGKIVGQYVG